MKRYVYLALIGALTFGAMSSCEKAETKTETGRYFTVTFNSGDGSSVETQQVLAGKLAVEPADPTRDGYDFVEWTRDEKGALGWSFLNYVVRGNVTLYAQWESTEDVRLMLESAVSKSADYNESDFTAESWNLFAATFNSAQNALQNRAATDAQLQSALDNLSNAADNLIPVQGTGDTSLKYILNLAINAAEALSPSDYTNDTYGYLLEILDEAHVVNANDDATRVQVELAIRNLSTALEGLVAVN